jgi:hypothetical protein
MQSEHERYQEGGKRIPGNPSTIVQNMRGAGFMIAANYITPATIRNLVTAVLASGDLGRPFIVPPWVPTDRLKTLRDAFQKTMSDQAFLVDVKTRKLETDPSSGDELETIAKEAVNQPRDVVERMKKILAE